VKKSSKFIQTKCGFCGFQFELVRFAVLLLDWFGYDHALRWDQGNNRFDFSVLSRANKD
jgi:hypothetical protein